MNINYNFKFLLPYSFIFLFVYIFNSILFLNLPKKQVEVINLNNKDVKYAVYNNFFSAEIKEKKKGKKNELKEYLSIDKIILSAIYKQDDENSWAIVQDKNSKETQILSIGEEYKSYKLKKVFPSYIILEKNSKEYKIVFLDNFLKSNYTINNSSSKDIFVSGSGTVIKREYLNSYINDLSKVWKNISINEIRKNGKIDGFKVLSVKNNSVFEKIGLKKYDIIKSVNNKRLKSYKDAFSLYKNIDKIDYFLVEILRDNEIMELSYEIN